MEVAVPADGWAGAAVPGAFPIVHALARSGGEVLHRDGFWERSHRRGDVVQHPVHPNRLWRLGVGCVGIVNDEREALRARWSLAPLEGRGEILAVAGVFLGDVPVRRERR